MIAAQPTIIQDISTAIRPYGLDARDVADAYALWWINSWLVANKRDEDPDRGTIAMVKQQARNAFAAIPAFADTSDADRQEYAEALLLQATILSSAFEQWQDDPAMLDQLAQAARQGAKTNGLNLSLMTLTRNGFVPSEGTEATDVSRATLCFVEKLVEENIEGAMLKVGLRLRDGQYRPLPVSYQGISSIPTRSY